MLPPAGLEYMFSCMEITFIERKENVFPTKRGESDKSATTAQKRALMNLGRAASICLFSLFPCRIDHVSTLTGP